MKSLVSPFLSSVRRGRLSAPLSFVFSNLRDDVVDFFVSASLFMTETSPPPPFLQRRTDGRRLRNFPLIFLGLRLIKAGRLSRPLILVPPLRVPDACRSFSQLSPPLIRPSFVSVLSISNPELFPLLERNSPFSSLGSQAIRVHSNLMILPIDSSVDF